MGSIEYGAKRVYNEIIGGIVISTFINSLEAIPTPELSTYLMWFRIISFLSTLALIVSTTKWTIGYFFGWCIGIGILSYAGLANIWNLIIYLFLPVGLRLLIWYYKEKEGA